MNTAAMKRFAAQERARLCGDNSELSGYIWFMRLCAAYIAEPEWLREIMRGNAGARAGQFLALCAELRGALGGIFALYGDIQPFPDSLLADVGTAHELLHISADDLPLVPESLCWLHQDFNAPVRVAAINALKRRENLDTDDIALSTQIFTPDWIVRYMVQNTLVLRWYELGGAELPAKHSEYICGDILRSSGEVSPESMTFLDPCCGCGSILAYAFDVLMDMYRANGYSDDIAAEKVLSRSLYGLELDERARAVCETVLRLKSRRFGINAAPQVYSFAGTGIAETVGSLARADMIPDSGARKVLSMCFDVVATNPPYLASAGMNAELSAFITENYSPYRADLFAVFMVRCLELTSRGGRLGFLTPYVWLFIRSFEPLRRLIYAQASVQSLVQLEYSAFDEATVPLCTFTLRNAPPDEMSTFIRLSDFRGGMQIQRERLLMALHDENCQYRYTADVSDFAQIPCAPMAYWVSPQTLSLFSGRTVSDLAPVRQGIITGDNDRFLRLWYEVEPQDIAFTRAPDRKWHPLNKGGSYRKWYGNRDYVVLWEDGGAEIRSFTDDSGRLRSRPQNLEYCFRPSVSWTLVTTGDFSVRFYDDTFMFNVAGSSAFPEDRASLMFMLAMLNSSSAAYLTSVVNPTMNLNVGDTARLPLPEVPEPQRSRLAELAEENVAICREDWDSSETSWDFRRHPLI